MRVRMLKAKLHRATVTDANLEYEGSITIDRALCDKAGLFENEQVDIYNCNNGARFTTYVIYGDTGQICLNGAAARHVHHGDLVIIAAYADFDQDEASQHQPKVLLLDEKNEPKPVN
ncbi:MAG: aspartate 1-decarboxylase [Bdellovibrionales bacterium]|nr:aspartate 1-decarboxylase [Bdellovibrionales bacterium]